MRLPLLLALALLAALPAQAQPQRNAAPQAGPLQVTAEPTTVDVRAGGPDRNAVPGNGCSGYINNGEATATVALGSGGPLAIYATSDTDTTLLVLDPAGRWHCSDDANGSDPAVTFPNAAAGEYRVWVGSFSPGTAPARLHVVSGQPRW